MGGNDGEKGGKDFEQTAVGPVGEAGEGVENVVGGFGDFTVVVKMPAEDEGGNDEGQKEGTFAAGERGNVESKYGGDDFTESGSFHVGECSRGGRDAPNARGPGDGGRDNGERR